MSTPRSRSVALILGLMLAIAACSSAGDATDVDPLPTLDVDGFTQLIETSPKPLVVNVWASWCTPCRSEAPLLREAQARHGDDVTFIGIDVQDSQDGARAFIAEFGLDGFDHYFDAPGAIPASLGAFGVPLTFYLAPGGSLVAIDRGALDEQSLALGIDELLALDG